MEQIEFTGSTLLFFTISTEALDLAGSALPWSFYFPFMRGCHSIIFPRVGLYPLTFGGRTGGGAAGLVIWGLPGRRKILVLNKLDLQPSLGSGCAWDETRGNRSLTGNVWFWNRRLAPERWRCLIWGFCFSRGFFFCNRKKGYFISPEANQVTAWN